jgi:hypothetical protein
MQLVAANFSGFAGTDATIGSVSVSAGVTNQSFEILLSGDTAALPSGASGNIVYYVQLKNVSCGANQTSINNLAMEVLYRQDYQAATASDATTYTSTSSAFATVKTFTFAVSGARRVEMVRLRGRISDSCGLGIESPAMQLVATNFSGFAGTDDTIGTVSVSAGVTNQTFEISDMLNLSQYGVTGNIVLYVQLKNVSCGANQTSINNLAMEVLYSTTTYAPVLSSTTIPTIINGSTVPLRFTRGSVTSTNADAIKDSQCATEYGATYVAATAQDLMLYWKGGNTGTGSFGIVVAGLSQYLYQSVGSSSGTWNSSSSATFPVACLAVDAHMRFTRGSVTSTNADAIKDAQCATEFGSSYVAATAQDVMGNFGSANTGTGSFGIVVAGLSQYLYQSVGTGSGSWNSSSSATFPVACIHQ